MVPTLKVAEYIDAYRLRLTFSDGKVGELDLPDEQWGEMFEPLKHIELFKSFRIDQELGTVVWPQRC